MLAAVRVYARDARLLFLKLCVAVPVGTQTLWLAEAVVRTESIIVLQSSNNFQYCNSR